MGERFSSALAVATKQSDKSAGRILGVLRNLIVSIQTRGGSAHCMDIID